MDAGNRSHGVVASDPVHEEALGLLMRLLVLRATVQRELDVEPPASLQALYQDIRSGHPA